MKAIYAKDIKAMVKQFDLNEAESDYLNDIAEAINKERTDLCEDIQMTLLYGSYSKSKRNAIRALLVYFGAKAQERAISLQIGYMVAVVSLYVATHSYLPTQPLNLWVMVCMKQKLLKCALYVSPQDCTTYSSQKYSRAMWYAWTETRSTPMSLSGARNTRLSWHVASRQRQDLQTLPHSYRLK